MGSHVLMVEILPLAIEFLFSVFPTVTVHRKKTEIRDFELASMLGEGLE